MNAIHGLDQANLLLLFPTPQPIIFIVTVVQQKPSEDGLASQDTDMNIKCGNDEGQRPPWVVRSRPSSIQGANVWCTLDRQTPPSAAATSTLLYRGPSTRKKIGIVTNTVRTSESENSTSSVWSGNHKNKPKSQPSLNIPVICHYQSTLVTAVIVFTPHHLSWKSRFQLGWHKFRMSASAYPTTQSLTSALLKFYYAHINSAERFWKKLPQGDDEISPQTEHLFYFYQSLLPWRRKVFVPHQKLISFLFKYIF